MCEDITVIRFARLGPLPEFIRDCANNYLERGF